jgi:hypothetical protein
MNALSRHSETLRRIKERGEYIEFTKDTITHDETTGVQTELSLDVVVGYAVQLKDELAHYRGMTLIERDPVTLLFVPSAINNSPVLNARCTWGDVQRLVRHFRIIRADGLVIGARIIAIV